MDLAGLLKPKSSSKAAPDEATAPIKAIMQPSNRKRSGRMWAKLNVTVKLSSLQKFQQKKYQNMQLETMARVRGMVYI